jgi:hypothetical protein
MKKQWAQKFYTKMEGLEERLEARREQRRLISIYQVELKKRRTAGAEIRAYEIDTGVRKKEKNKKIS